MTTPTPQPAGRKVDLSAVVQEQSATIGAMHTNLTMANLAIDALERQLVDALERLAGYENDVAVTDDAPESRGISGV